jgi:hypothetical protein
LAAGAAVGAGGNIYVAAVYDFYFAVKIFAKYFDHGGSISLGAGRAV